MYVLKRTKFKLNKNKNLPVFIFIFGHHFVCDFLHEAKCKV